MLACIEHNLGGAAQGSLGGAAEGNLLTPGSDEPAGNIAFEDGKSTFLEDEERSGGVVKIEGPNMGELLVNSQLEKSLACVEDLSKQLFRNGAGKIRHWGVPQKLQDINLILYDSCHLDIEQSIPELRLVVPQADLKLAQEQHRQAQFEVAALRENIGAHL